MQKILLTLRPWLLLLVTTLATSLKGNAEENIQLYYSDFPPYSIHTEHEKPRGILIDYFSHMMNAAGLGFNFKFYPQKRIESVIDAGRANIFPAFYHFIDQEYYYVSSKPILALHFNLYWMKGTAPVDSITDLNNTSLGVIFGYTYNGTVDAIPETSNVLVKAIAHSKSSLEVLRRGRVQYLINYSASMNYNFSKEELNMLESAPVGMVHQYLALNKSLDNAEEKLSQLEKAYMQAQKDGFIEEAFERYSKQ